MKNKRISKRILAFMLALLMVLSSNGITSLTVYAADNYERNGSAEASFSDATFITSENENDNESVCVDDFSAEEENEDVTIEDSTENDSLGGTDLDDSQEENSEDILNIDEENSLSENSLSENEIIIIDDSMSLTNEEIVTDNEAFSVIYNDSLDGANMPTITPLVSNNIRALSGARWASTVQGNLFVNSDGTLSRVEYDNTTKKVYIEVYTTKGDFVSGQTLTMELPLWGGVYMGSTYNFIVFGQTNFEDSNDVEVVRVVRYDKSWNRIDSVSYYGINTYYPFHAGSLRMVEKGNELFIQTCHEMYLSSDGYHHQANMFLVLNYKTMTPIFSGYKVSNVHAYCSHSFNQFITTDGTNIFTADHGDAYNRSLNIHKYSLSDYSVIDLKPTNIDVFLIAGEIGNNTTGAFLGGLQASGTGVLVAANSVDQTAASVNFAGQRNILITYTPTSSFTTASTKQNWITNYVNGEKVTSPSLVKITSSKFLLMWGVDDKRLNYCLLDGTGTKISDIYSLVGVNMFDGEPVVVGSKVTWYETKNSAPIFHEIDTSLINTNYKPYTLTQPEKNTYIVGETLSLDGTMIHSNADGKDIEVTESMISGFNTETAGVKTVKVTYDVYEFTYQILVLSDAYEMNGVYGDTLRDVTLPTSSYGTFSWKEATSTLVGAAGENVHGLIFTANASSEFHSREDVTGKVLVTRSISDAVITIPICPYTGNAVKPDAEIVMDGITLQEGVDFEYTSYLNNIAMGTATVTITGKGFYTGSIDKDFTIGNPVIVIKVNDLEIDAGSALPTSASFSYEISGLIGDDALTKEPILSCNITSTEERGKYTISASGAQADEKYIIQYVPATLTVMEYYTVTFKPNGHGAAPATYKNVKWESTISSPSINVSGYRFTGWYKDEACTEAWDFANDIVVENTILYAGWDQWTYTITFDQNYTISPIPTIQNVKYLDMIALSDSYYSREGYEIDHFYRYIGVYYYPNDKYLPGKEYNKFCTQDLQTVKLVPAWSLINYQIDYQMQDDEFDRAVNAATNPNTYTILSSTISLNEPQRHGYTFAGWYLDKAYTTPITEIISGSTGNVTVYAKWTPINYQIVFDANEGIGSQAGATLRYDQEYTLPSTSSFTRDECTLIGWFYKDENGEVIKYELGDKISRLADTEDEVITIYALWLGTLYDIAYVLESVVDGEVIEDTENPAVNSSKNPNTYTNTLEENLYAPTKTGYTFGGWYLDSAYTEKIDQIALGTRGNITLYAKWKENSYTIHFNANGGTGTEADVSLKYTEIYTLPEECGISKTGNHILYWCTTASATTGTTYEPGVQISKLLEEDGAELDLYPLWAANTYEITYVLEPVDNAGNIIETGTATAINSSSNPKNYKYNVKYASYYNYVYRIYNPSKTGYTFAGWYYDYSYENELPKESSYYVIPLDTIGDITLYAKWEERSYNLNLYYNDADNGYEVHELNYSERFELPSLNDELKPGYQLAGWSRYSDSSYILYYPGDTVYALSAVQDAIVNYYAVWTLKKYKLNYILNPVDADGNEITDVFSTVFNGNYKTYSYNETKDITIYPLSKVGYTFEGWYLDPEYTQELTKNANGYCIPAGTKADYTLYAKWTENSYTLILRPGYGNADTTVQLKYSEEYTLPVGNAYNADNKYFAFWNTSSDNYNYGTTYQPGATVSGLSYKNGATVYLYGYWGTKFYMVSYDSCGGTEITDGLKVWNGWSYAYALNEAGVTSQKFPVPTKEGYDFAGWYTAAEGGNKVLESQKYSLSEDQTLYAHWIPKTYAITLNYGYDDKTDTYQVIMGSAYGELPSPQRYGYRFDAWYTEIEGGDKVSGEEIFGFESPQTLFAHWIPVCYITFDTNGGQFTDCNLEESVRIITVDKGMALAAWPEAEQAGADFAGWYTEPLTGNLVDTTEDVSEDITVYAHWTWKYAVSNVISNTSEDILLHENNTIALSTETTMSTIYFLIINDDDISADEVITREKIMQEGKIYTSRISLSQDATIYTFASAPKYNDSEITSFHYVMFKESENWGDITEEEAEENGFDTPLDIPEGIWISGMKESVPYTGKAITFDLHIYDHKVLLTENVDYTIKYTNNIKAGTATLKITGKGNYKGTITKTFTITPLDISGAQIDDVWTTYNGRAQKLTTTVVMTVNGTNVILKKGTDFNYIYPGTNKTMLGYNANAFVSAQDHVASIIGKGNYTGEANFTIHIMENVTPMNKVSVNKIADQPYNDGEAVELQADQLILKYGSGNTLALGTDYDIVGYLNNYEIGTATIILQGMGNYVGIRKVTFKIVGIPMSKVSLQGFNANMNYTGKEIFQDVNLAYITGKGESQVVTPLFKLEEGESGSGYTVRYEKNINVGTATVYYTGVGLYTGTIKKTFKIVPYDLSKDFATNGNRISVTLEESYVYEKGGVKPFPLVTYSYEGLTYTLRNGVDYTLKYINVSAVTEGKEIAPGKLPTVTIVGKGNFKGNFVGEKPLTFDITYSNLAETMVTATDVVWNENKAGICKSTIVLYDANGQKLTAGTDYSKTFTYKYTQETMVSQIVDGKRITVLRKNNEVVNVKDIIPLGTVIRAEITAMDNGKCNYQGSTSVTFRFVRFNIDKAKLTIDSMVYTGQNIEFTEEQLIITLNGQQILDENYRIVSQTNNLNTGTATIVIEGLNEYGGTLKRTFKITARGLI